MADTTKTLPPLPQPCATSATWNSDDGTAWQEWYDATDPMPTEWDDEAPDEVVHVYTADQMRAYAEAALAAQAQPTEVSRPDYGPAWLGAAAARVLAQPEVAARHLRDYAALPAAQAQGEPVAWIRHDWCGSGERILTFDGPPHPKPIRDEVVNPVWTPLYTAPPPAAQPVRQPLTDEQIKAIVREAAEGAALRRDGGTSLRIARAIERAHGITGQEGGAA